jgi:predicted nucleic acid-binding protein
MVVGSHLTDTNILLRVSQRNDPDYDLILSAVRSLRASGATLWYTSQNLAEFWNVCTRPARQNGYGMTVAETNRRAELIERGFTLLPDDPRVHTEWRRLVVAHALRYCCGFSGARPGPRPPRPLPGPGGGGSVCGL